eukprot:TRINITY_DN20612_c1_g1_i1.p1 TRINITY_DN20612_c1_g1~~TRINITY_DN20612_c1_g1_i1.p1  ORF type:complete len:225 (+),score=62.90 TRINITY_DN20612_c1_g1_i1:67-675(+)
MGLTPAEQARQERKEYSERQHAKATEGCVKLRKKEDWEEWHDAAKGKVFYYCLSNNFITGNISRTPFEGKPKINEPEPEYVDQDELTAEFTPQDAPVSGLLNTCDIQKEISGGAGTVIQFLDKNQEWIERENRSHRKSDAELQEEIAKNEQAEKLKTEEAAREAKAKREAQQKQNEKKKRKTDKITEFEAMMAAQLNKKVRK